MKTTAARIIIALFFGLIVGVIVGILHQKEVTQYRGTVEWEFHLKDALFNGFLVTSGICLFLFRKEIIHIFKGNSLDNE